MAEYKVEICGVNTSKLPLLTNEEKTDLFRRIQNGDTDARETYIKGNLRYDKYGPAKGDALIEKSHSNYVGPTQLGISFIYFIQ